MGNVALPNGNTKYDLMDLTVESLDDWASLQGKSVSIDIGAFAQAKGSIVYFVQKEQSPRQAVSSVA